MGSMYSQKWTVLGLLAWELRVSENFFEADRGFGFYILNGNL